MENSQSEIDSLIKILSQYEVISFDIFDTLITRCLLKPVDVFQLVELITAQQVGTTISFAEIRENAEKKLNFSLGYPSFDEIYDEIKSLSNLPEDTVAKIKEIEFKTELGLLVARKDILALFKILKKNGKRVVLISDMYFSSEQLSAFLENCGYDLQGVELIVSNEQKKSKQDGSLWAKLARRKGVLKWFHIGDNLIGDVRYPKAYGFDVLDKDTRIYTPLEQFSKHPLSKILNKYLNGNISEKLILGRIVAFSVFNNAFLTSSKDIVGAWLGPMMGKFMDFLFEESQKFRNPFFLFVTREGYIFRPFFLKYCKTIGREAPPNCLFFASRVSTSLAGIRSIKDIEVLADTPFSGTVEEFIEKKLGLCFIVKDKLKTYSLPSEKKIFLNEIKPYLPRIFDEARNQNNLYTEYCHGIFPEELPILVDIGFTGRTQYNLSKILSRQVGGLYIMLENRNLPQANGCFADSMLRLPNLIYENLPYFEASLQVRKQSVLRLERKDETIKPLLADGILVPSVVQENFSSVLDFVGYYAKWKKELKEDFKLNEIFIEDVWMGVLTSNLLPQAYLKALLLEDDFSGLGLLNVSEKKINSQQLSMLFFKTKIKNVIKEHVPLIAYNFAREFWIKYFK